MLCEMKTKTFSIAAVFLFIFFSLSLISSTSASNYKENISTDEKTVQSRKNTETIEQEQKAVEITVDGYCEFLNTIAASDPHHLYDEKLREGSALASIDSLSPARLTPQEAARR